MFFDGLPFFLTYSFLIRLEFERNVLIVNEYIWLRYVEKKKKNNCDINQYFKALKIYHSGISRFDIDRTSP